MARSLFPLIAALGLAAAACGKSKASDDIPNVKAPKASSLDSEPTPVAPDRPDRASVKRLGGSASGAVPADPKAAGTASSPGATNSPGDRRTKDPSQTIAIEDLSAEGECVAECTRRNQMRAVGAEQIERECKAECAAVRKCVAECVQRNQMRAVAAEQIDADCEAECAEE